MKNRRQKNRDDVSKKKKKKKKKLDDLSSLLSRPSSQVLFLSSLDSAMIAIRIKEQRT